ncbi:MAG: Fe(3+) ABC transporter substrate-binding protein [Thioalkalivibrio sp.]|nr:Fe(3+) ABC transporter substrate-binding protein [Thioalkalivibrio sp.]
MFRNPLRLLGIAALAAAIGLPVSASAEGEVNVYSARQENLIKPLLDDFTRDTGVTVNLLTGRADELLQRLRLEGRNSPADVLITVDAGNLHQAKQAEVLSPIDSPVLNERIPENFRDVDGHWYGLSLRARPIMYNKDTVDPSELSTYEALADPKWRSRICIRSSSNIYNQSLVASMIASNGAEATSEWAEGLVENFARPPQGGDRDQIRAAAAGVCDIAIANTYYLGGMLAGDDPDQRAVAQQIGVFFPNQDGRGTHVNVSGAGVTEHAPNPENGARLIEYLTGEEAQRWYAEANQEYPVRPEVPASEILRSFGDFKADSLNLSLLGEYNAEAVRIMDRAGWR